MKVILLHNVKKIGSQGDVVDVADGYANGFLLPKKLARIATSEALSSLDAQKTKVNANHEEKIKEHKKLVDSVKGKSVTITAQANEKDQLFAAIHEKDVVAAIQNALGVMIDSENIELSGEIKMLGTHKVYVRAGEASGTFELEVSKK